MTSSTRSARRLLTPDDRAALTAAISTVCETSFFAMVEPAPSEPAAETGTPDAWYQADLAFSGPFAGRVSVALPVPLAEEMFAAFLGCDDDDEANAAEIQDVVGEFANMVCGAWLTGRNDRDVFSLARPEVRRVRTPQVVTPTPLLINFQPAVIDVDLVAEAL